MAKNNNSDSNRSEQTDLIVDEALTYRKYGYCGFEFQIGERTKVVGVCSACNKTFDTTLANRVGVCRSCLSTNINFGRGRGKMGDEQKRKISASHQGISYNDWSGYVGGGKYCHKFNAACRESNRDRYDRQCFLCGKDEGGEGRKLSVHHVDMNKQQGCDDHTWKLVPLCRSCHGRVHSKLWQARIEYILNMINGSN